MRAILILFLLLSAKIVCAEFEVEIKTAEGTLESRAPDDAPSKLHRVSAGSKFFKPVTFQTKADSFADIYFNCGSAIRIAPSSAITVVLANWTNGVSIVQIQLDRGSLFIGGTLVNPSSKFEIKFSDGACAVRSASALKISANGVVDLLQGNIAVVYVIKEIPLPPVFATAKASISPAAPPISIDLDSKTSDEIRLITESFNPFNRSPASR